MSFLNNKVVRLKLEKNDFLIPFWNDKNKNLCCGFTLPVLGNQALTRKSITSNRTTRENRLNLASLLDVKSDFIFSPHQIHSDIIITVTEKNRGCGAYSILNAVYGDGCITQLKNTLLITTWADCIPVLLFDPENQWIGSIHSGWKGTCANIVGKTIKLLINKGVNVKHLYATIGPGIRDCCYEVRNDFKTYFSENLYDCFVRKNGKLFFNLSQVVYKQLLLNGISENRIDYYAKCTCCNKEPLFFSYRKDKKNFEAQAAFICMYDN